MKKLSISIIAIILCLLVFLWSVFILIHKSNDASYYTEPQWDTRQVSYIQKSESANTCEIPNLEHLNKAFGNALYKHGTHPFEEESPDFFDLMDYHFENRDLVAKTFGVEVDYPYRESMNDVLNSLKAYGYNREEIYNVYRKFAFKLPSVSIEEVKQNGPKTYEIYEIFNQGRISDIQYYINNMLNLDTLVPAYILQIDLYRSQNNIDNIFKVSEKLIDFIHAQNIDEQYKYLILGDIIELGKFYAYKDTLAIEGLINKSEHDIKMSSIYLLYFLELGGVW